MLAICEPLSVEFNWHGIRPSTESTEIRYFEARAGRLSSKRFALRPQGNDLLLEIVSEPLQAGLLVELIAEIDEYRSYPAKWDGICSEAPDADCLTAAQDFLRVLPRHCLLPRPTVSGGEDVALYWRTNLEYLIVNFNRNGTLTYFYKSNKRKDSGDDVAFLRSSVPPRLKVLIENFRA